MYIHNTDSGNSQPWSLYTIFVTILSMYSFYLSSPFTVFIATRSQIKRLILTLQVYVHVLCDGCIMTKLPKDILLRTYTLLGDVLPYMWRESVCGCESYKRKTGGGGPSVYVLLLLVN